MSGMEFLLANTNNWLNFVSKMFWPGAIFAIILIFRDPLFTLLNDLKKIKVFNQILFEREHSALPEETIKDLNQENQETQRREEEKKDFEKKINALEESLNQTEKQSKKELEELRNKAIDLIKFWIKESEKWEFRFLSRHLSGWDIEFLRALHPINHPYPKTDWEISKEKPSLGNISSSKKNVIAFELAVETTSNRLSGSYPATFITEKGTRFLSSIDHDPLTIDPEKQMQGLLGMLKDLNKK